MGGWRGGPGPPAEPARAGGSPQVGGEERGRPQPAERPFARAALAPGSRRSRGAASRRREARRSAVRARPWEGGGAGGWDTAALGVITEDGGRNRDAGRRRRLGLGCYGALPPRFSHESQRRCRPPILVGGALGGCGRSLHAGPAFQRRTSPDSGEIMGSIRDAVPVLRRLHVPITTGDPSALATPDPPSGRQPRRSLRPPCMLRSGNCPLEGRATQPSCGGVLGPGLPCVCTWGMGRWLCVASLACLGGKWASWNVQVCVYGCA